LLRAPHHASERQEPWYQVFAKGGVKKVFGICMKLDER
jgi:hypothetical protein